MSWDKKLNANLKNGENVSTFLSSKIFLFYSTGFWSKLKTDFKVGKDKRFLFIVNIKYSNSILKQQENRPDTFLWIKVNKFFRFNFLLMLIWLWKETHCWPEPISCTQFNFENILYLHDYEENRLNLVIITYLVVSWDTKVKFWPEWWSNYLTLYHSTFLIKYRKKLLHQNEN